MKTKTIQSKIKLHDGIVGMTYLLSIILSVTVNMQWLYLAGAVAVLQVLSMFTGFCPVYYVINKLIPDAEPIEGSPKAV